MSYQVLARKWRPRDFSQVVGQEAVVRALTNALDEERLHHAYLFTGTRGVGKTTLARILAKALNCEQGVSAQPCGQCSACQEVDQGRFADLIEVDAASRTKVDQTRELLENVPFAPIRGRYKVYLIDEVHMFSDSSFNALLKTLEEPPPHVKFLLATTDPQKVPVTVLSRCLQLNLKRLSVEQIRHQFEHILEAEGIEGEPEALTILARAADGSMRDGLSLLDQAIGFGGGKVKAADVKAMLGILAQERLPLLMEALAEGDAARLLQTIEAMAADSPDFGALLKELVLLLHRTALLQAVPRLDDEGWGDRQLLQRLAERFHPEEIQLFYEIALRGQRDLPLAPDPRSGFEMILLRMLLFRPEPLSMSAAPAQGPKETPSSPPPAGTHSPPAPAAPETRPPLEAWDQVVPQLELGGISAQLAAHCTVQSWDGRRLVLALDPAGKALTTSSAAEKRLRDALARWLGRPLELQIQVAAAPAGTETPAQKRARQMQARREAALADFRDDPLVKMVEESFDGELVEKSIELDKK